MLELKNIKKSYKAGDTVTTALDGVTLSFGECEFVSVLGTSGSGKTTLLNIIGGLDTYDGGDLIINGKSTKEYKSRDWDTYRNHSVGFVFQSYNLIPHQTVLSNVELALTLSGVPKSERRRRAKEALEAVGLGDQLKKKPSQMSGGQMQRVAIARALVNDPEILLADEPTGALDTETSIQIMNILHRISKNRLVIMVTHNPELAETYSTRIVRLRDGKIVSDDPNAPIEYTGEKPEKKAAPVSKGRKKKTSMSFFTALSLSLNNLMTKRARTILTSFAGSIGIIGIALILALSSGIQAYINKVQEDTLSEYPISIVEESVDFDEILEMVSGKAEPGEHGDDKVYSAPRIYDMFDTMNNMDTTKNNLKDFKTYLDGNGAFDEFISAVSYGYNADLLIYGKDEDGNLVKVNPSTVMASMQQAMGVNVTASGSSIYTQMTSNSMKVWSEIIPARDGGLINDLVKSQYDVVAGDWPTKAEEVVLVMDSHNEISDVYLYSLGLKDQSEIESIVSGEYEKSEEQESWEYDQLIGKTFYAMLPCAVYSDSDGDGVWTDMSDNGDYMKIAAESAIELRVCGIIRPNPEATSTSIQGAMGYTHALTEKLINDTNSAPIVLKQKEDPTVDVFTGLPFESEETEEMTEGEKAQSFRSHTEKLTGSGKAELYTKIACTVPEETLAESVAAAMQQYPDRASKEAAIVSAYSQSSGADSSAVESYTANMSDEELDETVTQLVSAQISAQYAQKASAQLSSLTEEQLAAALDAAVAGADEATLSSYYDSFMPATVSDSTYEDNMRALSAVDLDSPSTVNIYAVTFQAKDEIANLISDYNKGVAEEDKISYTDYVAVLMSSVTTIINAISYVLIAFVSISLVVSSVMIGIITYISVLERTKEIGILRAIGASKKDISRVFNAETLIVGLTAGLLGIGITELLSIPINIIIKNLTDISNVAALPWEAGVILVIISVVLTVLSGLIPAFFAAKKDPVEALRSE
ncbi:MAG: ABC transporter ATP-binding protein/permease [Clostridia bacterium]|nr:ABC transporter ATP-binding protein/permease [Clostridia bacterium]